MSKYAPLIIIAILLVALAAIVVWAAQSDSEALDDLLAELDIETDSTDGIEGSGFIEADSVTLSAQLGGRIKSVEVSEGDSVLQGDELVEVDTASLAAQVRRAAAAVSAAESELEQLEAGARPEQIRQAEAALAQAEAAQDGARRALQDAIDARDDPRQLELELGGAETAVDVTQQQVVAAQAQLRAANSRVAQAEDALTVAEAGTAAQVAQARSALHQAQDLALQAQMAVALAEVDEEEARVRLALLGETRDNPIALEAAVDQASAELQMANAAVKAAAAGARLARAGPTDNQLRLAEAALAQAEAELKLLQAQLDLGEVVSPLDGTVLEVFADVGETVATGTPLVTVGSLTPMEIAVFVAETDIGDLELGQSAVVTVDAYEDEEFDGEVVRIASEAEFTPKNVQTKEDRANLVYAVVIRVPNDDGDLKPGMPADVVIETD
jgi:multidrug resistance efflux pump